MTYKINGTNIVKLPELAELYYKTLDKSTRISKIKEELTKLTSKYLNDTLNINNIIADLYKIITAKPYELKEFSNKYDQIFYDITTQKQNPFGKAIENAFGYSKFRLSLDATWLAKHLNVKTCLYCNTAFTLTVANTKKKKKNLLFQFDHFYPKSKFPHLSLSFFNLIPSCGNCNQLMSDKNDRIDDYFHPYLTSFDDVLNFGVLDSVKKSLAPKKKLKLELNVNDKKHTDHVEQLLLKERYEQFNDIIEELYWKSKVYNKSYRDELKKQFATLNLSDPEINRFILGNYSNEDDLNKRPLAKLYKDIGKELKLI